MGIVLAVKKKNTICIASDSMTIVGGNRKQLVSPEEKIIKWGTSFIGVAGHPVWPLVLRNYISHTKRKPLLRSKEEIFEVLLEMHQVLKDRYFLTPEEDEEDSFESSRLETLIVNPHGIFKTYEQRSVQNFMHFAAIGSGSSYALGAIHALYERLHSAEEIAKEALEATVGFDDSSGLPGNLYMVKLK